MGNLWKLIIFILYTGLVSKSVLVSFLEQMKDRWDVCRRKSVSAPPGRWEWRCRCHRWETQRSQRKQEVQVCLGSCASVQRILQSPDLFLLLSYRASWSPTVSQCPTCLQNSVFTPVASVIPLAFGVKLLPLDSGDHHGLAPLALIRGHGKICAFYS